MSFLSKIFNKGPKPIFAHSKEGNLAALGYADPEAPAPQYKPGGEVQFIK